MTQVSEIGGGSSNLAVHGSGALAGILPPAGAAIIIQGGTVVASATPYALTFPTPFPNGLVSVVVCDGDMSVNGPAGLRNQAGDYTLSGCVLIYSPNGNFRLDWLAIGW